LLVICEFVNKRLNAFVRSFKQKNSIEHELRKP